MYDHDSRCPSCGDQLVKIITDPQVRSNWQGEVPVEMCGWCKCGAHCPSDNYAAEAKLPICLEYVEIRAGSPIWGGPIVCDDCWSDVL